MSKFKQLEKEFINMDYNLILSMLKCNLVNYDETNSDNQTLLHIALDYLESNHSSSYLEILNYLIEHTKNLDIQDSNGNLPLHLVMYHYDINIIDKVIKKTKNINLQNKDGNSALYYAIKFKKIDIIEIFFSHSNIIYNYKNKYNEMLIHIAIDMFSMFYNCIPIIKHLLDNIDDINAKKSNGNTILHMIFNHISFSNTDIINFLLEYPGLDFNILNKNRELPLHLAINTIRDTPDKMYIFEKIISKTNDINSQNINGSSPFILAFLSKKKSICNLLIKHPDIDFNLTNNNWRLLDEFLSYSNFADDLFLEIIKNTDNIFSLNYFGNTIFHEAFNKINFNLIKFLINYLKENNSLTENINILNKHNQTILDLAIKSSFSLNVIKPIIIDLILLGAKNNQIDKINSSLKPIMIYYSNALSFEELPEKIKLDKEESEKIINYRKQKIYHHPIIQRYLSNNLVTYSHLIKQKNNNKKIYKSSILLKRYIWRLHILSFSKEHYDDFFSNPLNKNIIDDFPLKLL